MTRPVPQLTIPVAHELSLLTVVDWSEVLFAAFGSLVPAPETEARFTIVVSEFGARTRTTTTSAVTPLAIAAWVHVVDAPVPEQDQAAGAATDVIEPPLGSESTSVSAPLEDGPLFFTVTVYSTVFAP